MNDTELKLRLVDMKQDERVWCMDPNGTTFSGLKKDMYIGKNGFTFGGDDKYLYVEYGYTWWFTEEEKFIALEKMKQQKALANEEKKRIEAENALKKAIESGKASDMVNKYGTTVYIVFVGEYSDKHVEQVTLDEEDAVRFRDEWNLMHTKDNGEVWYGEEACIEEYDTPNDRQATMDPINKRFIEVNYDVEKNEVRTCECEEAHLEEMAINGKGDRWFSFCILEKMIPEGTNCKRIERLLKIAQDRYAEYKARVLGAS